MLYIDTVNPSGVVSAKIICQSHVIARRLIYDVDIRLIVLYTQRMGEGPKQKPHFTTLGFPVNNASAAWKWITELHIPVYYKVQE